MEFEGVGNLFQGDLASGQDVALPLRTGQSMMELTRKECTDRRDLHQSRVMCYVRRRRRKFDTACRTEIPTTRFELVLKVDPTLLIEDRLIEWFKLMKGDVCCRSPLF